MAGHRFPRDIFLPAVRYYLQLRAAAERIVSLYIQLDRFLQACTETTTDRGPALGRAEVAEVDQVAPLTSG